MIEPAAITRSRTGEHIMPSFVDVRTSVLWENHHENVSRPVAKILTVRNENPNTPTLEGMKKTAERIQGVINEAIAVGARIRAVGSHWSFSDIPVVTDGWIVETNKLNWRFDVRPAVVRPDARVTHDELYFVQCGTLIARINEALETPNKVHPTKTRRRALRTSGASNGQTIAGALGTGVHGSALEVGGMESQVVGIQIITAERNLWIERASEPVMTDNFISQLGAEPVRDDLQFEAALVSLGSLGIVHSVMLKTTGRYLFETTSRQIRLGRLRTALNELRFDGSGVDDQNRTPYFFQGIIDPDDINERGDRAKVFTLTRYKHNCPDNHQPAYNLKQEHTDGTDLPKFISLILQLDPSLRDFAVSTLMEIFLREYEQKDDKKWKTPGQVYTFTEARRGVASSGFAVPIAQVTRALAMMADEFRRKKGAAVVLTCRYAQKSPAILGFTRYDPTCVIDIDGIDSPATQALIRDVGRRFANEGMPFTQHWGKTHSLSRTRVANAYGGSVDKWNQARREILRTPAERDAFSSDFIDSIGLNR
jgi:hypothetical protein